MGQQQLLLIVLGVIIVGIAVAVGIQMFAGGAATANFDAVSSDLNKIAADAQGWYRKPTTMGGGGRSFTGLTLPKLGFTSPNTNGTYTISGIAAGPPAEFTLTGVGTEDGDGDGTNVTVAIKVYPDSIGSFTETSR